MKKLPRLASALVALSATGSLFAVPLPGTKAKVTLTASVTAEVGGFLIKKSALATEANKNITYDTYSIRNPFDFDASDAANFETRFTEIRKSFGTGGNARSLATETTVDNVTKQVTLRYTNADFIREVIERNIVTGFTSPNGLQLVVIETRDQPNTYHNKATLFFIENSSGGTIRYVGRKNYSATFRGDALILNTSYGVETSTYKRRTTFNHKVEAGRVIEDTTGKVVTESETYNGTGYMSLYLFPSYYDSTTQSYVSSGEMSISSNGSATYAGRYDSAAKLYVTTGVTLSGTNGNFHNSVGENLSHLPTDGIAQTNLSFSGTKVIADITPYLNALPQELAALKQQIIDDYAPPAAE